VPAERSGPGLQVQWSELIHAVAVRPHAWMGRDKMRRTPSLVARAIALVSPGVATVAGHGAATVLRARFPSRVVRPQVKIRAAGGGDRCGDGIPVRDPGRGSVRLSGRGAAQRGASRSQRLTKSVPQAAIASALPNT
jgi:hypothetical protein